MALIVSMFAVACTSEVVTSTDDLETNKIVEENGNPMETYKVSVDEAKKTLSHFFESISESAKTYAVEGEPEKWNRDILDVAAYRAENEVKTYASESGIEIDTLMYVFNFKDNKGFALMAADKRTDPIIAIIDEGNISLDTIDRVENATFQAVFSKSVNHVVSDIESHVKTISSYVEPYEGDTLLNATYEIKIPILLKTKWGQGAPYGKFCPNEVAGCVPVAIGQALSYYQTLKGNISYNDSRYGQSGATYIDWYQIIRDCVSNTDGHSYGKIAANASSVNSIAQLLCYLGANMNSQYNYANNCKSASTGTVLGTAFSWIRNNKIFSANLPYSISYNNSTVVTALNNKNIIFISGSSSYINKCGYIVSVGHAWLIDGLIHKYNSKKTYESHFVHCNFGWNGICDGYYTSGIFDPKNSPIYGKDNIDYAALLQNEYSKTSPYFFNQDLQILPLNK